jgi:hypothetical protein
VTVPSVPVRAGGAGGSMAYRLGPERVRTCRATGPDDDVNRNFVISIRRKTWSGGGANNYCDLCILPTTVNSKVYSKPKNAQIKIQP